MTKPTSRSIRVVLAFGVAVTADLLQFPINAFTGTGVWALPGEMADFVLDLITSALLSLLIGFHPLLLPCFLVKAIPSVDEIPTWTACVAYLVWSRNRKAESQPQAMDDTQPEEIQPVGTKPKLVTLSAATIPGRLRNCGLWYLVATVALFAGLIWYTHGTAPSPHPVNYPRSSAPAPVIPPWPNGSTNPVVMVGHIDISIPSKSGVQNERWVASLERTRTYMEEMLRGIDGVEVCDKQQAQAFLSQWEQNPGGSGDPQCAAQPRKAASPVYVVLVTILDWKDVAANFRGYGIAQKSMDTECSLRLQVINALNGSVAFSRILNGAKTQFQTEIIQSSSTEDWVFEALKTALVKLEDDADFRSALRGCKGAEQVEVEFSPMPENCDIQIDGRYVGGSPLKIKLLSGRETEVRISKAGYRDWEGRLSPRAGLRVTSELEPADTTRQKP